MVVSEKKEDAKIVVEGIDKTDSEGKAESGERKIPCSIATQFCDNTFKPFWSFGKGNPIADDFFDCYVAFKELCCHEYLWDWKNRKIDELLVRKLLNAYPKFFNQKIMGKDCFITLRMGQKESIESLGRAFLSIIHSNRFAKDKGITEKPIFSMANSAKSANELLRFTKLYNETISLVKENLDNKPEPERISAITTHQFSDSLDWYGIIGKYLFDYQHSFRHKLDCMRVILPRHLLADNKGFVGSVLAVKNALSRYHAFSENTGVEILPIIETGSLMFRGGFRPGRAEDFISTYSGVRSVAATASVRYDYDIADVKETIIELNKKLMKEKSKEKSDEKPDFFSAEKMRRIEQLEEIFGRNYRRAMNSIANSKIIIELKESMEKINSRADPRIKNSFALYSLGIPPEFLGTGRAIIECIKEGNIKLLETVYPQIKQELICAGSLLNKENIILLSKTGRAWEEILTDVKLIEDYTDTSLGPDSTDSFIHRNHTSNVFHLYMTKRDFLKDLVCAANARHGLG
jgi:phosphoenolpyruvate carboxylase